jgi:hypothetical protein
VGEVTEKSEKEIREELCKNDGMAIYIKGKMVVGVRPDNLVKVLEGLAERRLHFDWKYGLELARKGEGK